MRSHIGSLRALVGPAGSLRGQLVRGGAGSFAVMAGGTLLSLLLAVVLARSLGAQGYGIYAFVFALVSIMAIPAQLGLPSLVIRETARAQANADWGLMKGVWRWSNRAALVSSLALAALGAALAWLLAGRFAETQLWTFAWGLALVPLVALGNLRGAALRGLRKVVQAQLPESIVRPGLLLPLVGGVALLAPGAITPAWAMALFAASALAAFLLGAWMLRRARPEELKSPLVAKSRTGAWLASTVSLALIDGMYLITQYTDTLMLGLFRNTEDVGVYRVVVQGASLVALGLSLVNTVAAPHFARLYAVLDKERLDFVAVTSARVALILAMPVTVIYLFFGREMLSLIRAVQRFRLEAGAECFA